MDPATFERRATDYLRDALVPGVEVHHARRILGGASRHTWSADARWSDAEGAAQMRGLIFRLDPPSSLLESNRGTEYAMYRALYGRADIPLPEPLCIEDDVTVLGMPFFVMERLEGSAWPHALLTPPFDGRREVIIRQMFRILGAIAAVDHRALGLDSVLAAPSADEAWAVELDRWDKTLHDHHLGPMPVTQGVIRELRRNPPPPARRVVIVHGDYRAGNVLFTPDGIVGVLDWELTHLGDPHEDLAWSMAKNWRSGATPEKIGSVLSPDEALAEWSSSSGVAFDRESLRWWQLFSHVKASAIWTTAAHEFATGRTDDLMFGTMGWRNVGAQERWAVEDLGLVAP